MRGILFFLFLFLSAAGCYSQGERELSVDESRQESADPFLWDFAEVKQGDVLTHVFTLENSSGANLNIKDVTTSCGCTASEVKSKTIPPGESTEIEVKFNSKGYSGPVEQFVYVNTDNADNPVLRLKIKAKVLNGKPASG